MRLAEIRAATENLGRRTGCRRATLISVVALSGLGGCGDSGQTDDARSKERYIKLADEKCRESDRLTVRLLSDASRRDPAEQRLAFRKAIQEGDVLIDEFLRLPEPPGDPSEVQEMESTLSEIKDKQHELLAAAEERDIDTALVLQNEVLELNNRFKEAAGEYGLENCATDNDLPRP
jgi:hypothetical protein